MRPPNAVTQETVAKHVGVSRSTAAAILAKKSKFSFAKETIAKVMKAAHELGYFEHGSARQFPRNGVNVSVEVTFLSDKKILAKGVALLRDISERGFLLRNIKITSGEFPLDNFSVELIIPELNVTNFSIKGTPLRIQNSDKKIEIVFERSDTDKYKLLKQLL